jgi:hypothetical protein
VTVKSANAVVNAAKTANAIAKTARAGKTENVNAKTANANARVASNIFDCPTHPLLHGGFLGYIIDKKRHAGL